MERSKLGLNIPYRDKLNDEERERYLSKIADIAGLDPYEHTVWSEDDFEILPPLN
ncbi:uncharacterized protein LOC119774761 [Xyrichtys novacula]|uniref:Uncharacterized protein LOC119774761 n=1 Tax=Xyrichtys novacula TaxID=13765 RepID=A0AAV1H445_XYRNO|nr:uncharacterized protein LOC119774761 [Xyrichtys novacula]